MILKIIENMGFFVGAIFGVSLVTAFRQITRVPRELYGWDVMRWDLSDLHFPSGLMAFLITFSIMFGWRRYQAVSRDDKLRTEAL